jgi:hypothetical protein
MEKAACAHVLDSNGLFQDNLARSTMMKTALASQVLEESADLPRKSPGSRPHHVTCLGNSDYTELG